MFCEKCGKKLQPGKDFCSSCGKKLSRVEARENGWIPAAGNTAAGAPNIRLIGIIAAAVVVIAAAIVLIVILAGGSGEESSSADRNQSFIDMVAGHSGVKTEAHGNGFQNPTFIDGNTITPGVDVGGGSGLCVGCDGSGRCHVCDGMGKNELTNYMGNTYAEYAECGICDGTGVCHYCDGTGKKY